MVIRNGYLRYIAGNEIWLKQGLGYTFTLVGIRIEVLFLYKIYLRRLKLVQIPSFSTGVLVKYICREIHFV